MNTRSNATKKELRILLHAFVLVMLLSLTTMVWHSAGFASAGPVAGGVETSPAKRDGLDAKTTALEESKSRVKEAIGDCALDSDALDMEGDWDLTAGYGFPGLTSDRAGHYVPAGS